MAGADDKEINDFINDYMEKAEIKWKGLKTVSKFDLEEFLEGKRIDVFRF